MDVFCLNISYMWTSDVGKYFCQCLWSFSSKLDWGLFRLYFSSLAMLKLLTILVEAQLLITLRFCVQFAMPTLYVRCKFLCCPNFNTTALSVYCTSVLVKQIFLVLHNVQWSLWSDQADLFCRVILTFSGVINDLRARVNFHF